MLFSNRPTAVQYLFYFNSSPKGCTGGHVNNFVMTNTYQNFFLVFVKVSSKNYLLRIFVKIVLKLRFVENCF
jgi:hypothetical protein